MPPWPVQHPDGLFVEFFHEFLRYISSPAHKSPLDFFSWHSYAGVPETAAYARYARETLDSYGFTNTENILNEWNRGLELRVPRETRPKSPPCSAPCRRGGSISASTTTGR